MVAVMWDDEVWLPPNITWEYFDHDDRLFDIIYITSTTKLITKVVLNISAG